MREPKLLLCLHFKNSSRKSVSMPSVTVADTAILLIGIVVFIQACTNVVLLSEWEPGREDSCLIQCGLWNWRQLSPESMAPKIFQVVHFNAVTGQNVDLFCPLAQKTTSRSWGRYRMVRMAVVTPERWNKPFLFQGMWCECADWQSK